MKDGKGNSGQQRYKSAGANRPMLGGRILLLAEASLTNAFSVVSALFLLARSGPVKVFSRQAASYPHQVKT